VQKFKAYRTFEDSKVISSRFVEMGVDDLDAGDVIVRTKYSTINYKDALSYNGGRKDLRKYPTNAGIDMAGTVESVVASAMEAWRQGDRPRATTWAWAHDGGYRRVRPGAGGLDRPPAGEHDGVRRDDDGHRGFTAAQAIMLMEHNGLRPAHGPVAVTRRHRRRRLGRDRDPRQAGLRGRGDHR